MNKKLSFILFLTLALSLLISSALSETVWERDPKEHWIVDANGGRTQVGAHQMNDVVCEICQSDIWLYDDGTCDITNYNEYEDVTRNSYYDADGALLDDYVYVYNYDGNGKKLFSFTYYFGILIEESEYALDPTGESVMKKSVGYNDDGSESIIECDIYGNTILSRMTDAQGQVIFEETYEYTYADDGFPIHTIQSSRFEDGTSFYVESDEMGNRISETQIDPDGTVVYAYDYTYDYDDNGRMLRELVSQYGQPVFETYYAYTEDPYDFFGYQCMTIDYFEDGSKVVCELDEFGEILRETAYDAEGNIES